MLYTTPAAALNGSMLLSEGRVTTMWVQSVEAVTVAPGGPTIDPTAATVDPVLEVTSPQRERSW